MGGVMGYWAKWLYLALLVKSNLDTQVVVEVALDLLSTMLQKGGK